MSGRLAGLVALFATPAAYEFAARTGTEIFPGAYDPSVMLFVASSVGMCLLMLIDRWRPLSAWAFGFLIVLHDCLWLAVLLVDRRGMWFYRHTPFSRFWVVFLLSGIAWLASFKTRTADTDNGCFETSKAGRAYTKSTYVAVAVVLVVAGAPYVPARGYRLTGSKDRDSLTVEMSRTGCFGSCPIYSITIHGDGEVAYTGDRFVGKHGTEATRISMEQVEALQSALDQTDFFALEGRAFTWCFDSPRVSVKVTAGKRTKQVWSDASCVGPRSGPQARLVKAAAEIDKIVGTEQWVKCGGQRCR